MGYSVRVVSSVWGNRVAIVPTDGHENGGFYGREVVWVRDAREAVARAEAYSAAHDVPMWGDRFA